LLGAAGAVIALALAVSAVFGTSTSAETRAVTAAAKGAARALYDYDYRHLDDFENHVVAASTPEFATTFRTQFREGLAKVIADSEETSITTRVSVTVHSVSASAARTTLLIDATQRAGVSSPAEPRNFHVEVRFIYEHKRWLISGVSTLAPPADVTGFR
jgi:flavin-binding protein dodecin